MSTENEQFEQAAKEYWFNEPLYDDVKFRVKACDLSNEIIYRVRSEDLPGIQYYQQLLYWIEPYITEEPLVSSYELALGHASLAIAGLLCEHRKWENVFEQVRSVLLMLSRGDKRRAHLGRRPRPNSELRLRSIDLLSLAKWQCGSEFRNLVLSPEEIISKYFTLCEQVTRFFANADQRYKGLQIIENMGFCGVEVCALAFRYCRSMIVTLVQHFNRIHGPYLAMEVGHCRDKPALKHHPWYWNFEIAKLHLSGVMTFDDLDYCATQRRRAMQLANKDGRELQATLKGLDRQYKWMARHCRRRLEIIGD